MPCLIRLYDGLCRCQREALRRSGRPVRAIGLLVRITLLLDVLRLRLLEMRSWIQLRVWMGRGRRLGLGRWWGRRRRRLWVRRLISDIGGGRHADLRRNWLPGPFCCCLRRTSRHIDFARGDRSAWLLQAIQLSGNFFRCRDIQVSFSLHLYADARGCTFRFLGRRRGHRETVWNCRPRFRLK